MVKYEVCENDICDGLFVFLFLCAEEGIMVLKD